MKELSSLSDLMQCEIIRHNGIAEIIIDYYDPNDFPKDAKNWGKTVRLYAYSANAELTNLEIYEDAWSYYQEIVNELKKSKS